MADEQRGPIDLLTERLDSLRAERVEALNSYQARHGAVQILEWVLGVLDDYDFNPPGLGGS